MGSAKLVIKQKALNSGIEEHNNAIILLNNSKSSIERIIPSLDLTFDLPYSFDSQV